MSPVGVVLEVTVFLMVRLDYSPNLVEECKVRNAKDSQDWSGQCPPLPNWDSMQDFKLLLLKFGWLLKDRKTSLLWDVIVSVESCVCEC